MPQISLFLMSLLSFNMWNALILSGMNTWRKAWKQQLAANVNLEYRLPTHLLTTLHLPYLHSKHSRDAIWCPVSMGKTRRPRWTPGRVFKKSPRVYCLVQSSNRNSRRVNVNPWMFCRFTIWKNKQFFICKRHQKAVVYPYGSKFWCPSSNARFTTKHVKRTAYQAGHIWGQALMPNPPIPSPQDWSESGEWWPFEQHCQKSQSHAKS